MATKAKAEAKPTEYVVLQRVVVRPAEDYGEVFDVADCSTGDLYPGMQNGVWVEVGRETAQNKEKAIDQYTEAAYDESGNRTREPRAGSFKAVAASSWKGGKRVFTQTTMTSEPIEDA